MGDMQRGLLMRCRELRGYVVEILISVAIYKFLRLLLCSVKYFSRKTKCTPRSSSTICAENDVPNVRFVLRRGQTLWSGRGVVHVLR